MNETTSDALWSILKGALIAMGGAATVYFSGIDWGQYGPWAAAIAAILLNALRKIIETADPSTTMPKVMLLIVTMLIIPANAQADCRCGLVCKCEPCPCNIRLCKSEKPTIADTVCRITCGNAGGSGVVVSAKDGEGVILTAKHVIDADRTARMVWVTLSDGRKVGAGVRSRHRSEDLAALTFTYSGADPIKARVAEQPPAAGARIWKVGYPATAQGQLLDVRTGTCLQNGNELASDAFIRQGDSGGGLFIDSGELVGIATHCLADPWHRPDNRARGVGTVLCHQFYMDV